MRIKVGTAIGNDNPENMTRLKMAQFTLAQSNEVDRSIFHWLYREIVLLVFWEDRYSVTGKDFRKQIRTFFTPEMTDTAPTPNTCWQRTFTSISPVSRMARISGCQRRVEFHPKNAGHSAVDSHRHFNRAADGGQCLTESSMVILLIRSTDGPAEPGPKDITMHIPFQPEKAKYMMGWD